ncbi:hypothetical protein [Novosphingobium sp. M1R2S20]|uniref:Parallel beta helix pectate lyase-like protein n=1 Tax=Novosphingobium rhizovicinum TaxID=3228928 RepID=A0ABV3RCX0_9SPHN
MSYAISKIVRDIRGVPVPDALVYVYGPEGALASLYNYLGAPINNPLGTNDNGLVEGYSTEEGYHTLKINYGGRERYVEEVLLGRGPLERANSAAAAAEAFTGPTYDTVIAGLAATESGGYFAVVSDGIATVYLNQEGSAIYQRDMVMAGALASADPGKGADLVKFRHNLLSAQAESVKAALERTVWADQFKTVADADDTACIERAIASGASEVRLSDRSYFISDEIVNNRICRLIGKGRQRTFIVQKDLTKGALVFQMAYLQGCGLEHVTVKADAPSEQAPGSSGVGVKVVNCNDNATFRSIDVTNFDTCFQVTGCFQLLLDDFRFLYFRTAGLHLTPVAGLGTEGAGNRFLTGKISNFGFTGDNTQSQGIWIEQASGEFFNTIDVTTVNRGIVIKPPVGSFARYLFMFQVLGDSCLDRNWLIDGTDGVVVANDLIQCWSSNSQGDGVEVRGENIDALSWNGGWGRDCRGHGFVIAGGTNVEIQSCEVTRNSAAASDTYHGVYVPPGSDVIARVLDCRIGNVSTTVNTSRQKDNVHIGAGVTGLVEVSQSDLNDPGVGGLPINCISTVVQRHFRGNTPLGSIGTNTSDRYAINAHSITTVGAGLTRYIGSGGALPGASDSVLLPCRYVAVAGFSVRVPVAPGVGELFTYTIMKNGVATAMTGAIANDEFAVDVPETDAFIMLATDSLSVRVETSGGAAVTYHSVAVVVEP